MKLYIKMNRTFLCVIFIYLCFLVGEAVFPQENDYLHLRKDDFESYLKNYDYTGIENVYKERKVNGWPGDFVCWKDRKIIIPKILDTIKEIPKRLSDDLKKYQQKNPSKGSKLITKNDMMVISINALKYNEYIKYIRRIKEKCITLEDECNINFYIFDFEGTEHEKKMEIRYYQVSSSNRSLEYAEGAEMELKCIKKWEEDILKKNNRTPPEFDIEIKFIKCDWENKKDEKREFKRIIFCDDRKNDPPCFRWKKDLKNGYPHKDELTFNLLIKFTKKDYDEDCDESFFKEMWEQGIWLDNIDDGVRITSASLYSSLIKSHENISGNPFKLYFARTRNFTPGKWKLNEDPITKNECNIKNIDLPQIERFIRRIMDSRSAEETKIELIGFADRTGDWEKNNGLLSKMRAESVKLWLLKRLGNLIDENNITTQPCDESYYKNNDKFADRFVEVRIY